MQISTRFSIATHMLVFVAVLSESCKATSGFMASSIGVNPVIIRKISAQLKRHDLLHVPPGTGGATLPRPAEEISLYDIYKAVESVDKDSLFNIHEKPNQACIIGRNIERVLNTHMTAAQAALENTLKTASVADLVREIKL